MVLMKADGECLIKAEKKENIERFEHIASTMETIQLTKFREPKLRDRLSSSSWKVYST